MLSCEFCEIFKTTFFIDHTTSENFSTNLWNRHSVFPYINGQKILRTLLRFHGSRLSYIFPRKFKVTDYLTDYYRLLTDYSCYSNFLDFSLQLVLDTWLIDLMRPWSAHESVSPPKHCFLNLWRCSRYTLWVSHIFPYSFQRRNQNPLKPLKWSVLRKYLTARNH